MDLYVCGNSGLLHPQPCRKWVMDTSNNCNHVTSGRIGDQEVCPLLPTIPTATFRDIENVEMRETHSENIVILTKAGKTVAIHARDGYDRTIEPSSIEPLAKHVDTQDVQDMWLWLEIPTNQTEEEIADDLFGDDYPRGPPAALGLLLRNGAIYSMKQDPFSIKELTDRNNRRPFLHALLRSELHDGQRDTWPAVVFPEQPDTVYRLSNTENLLAWLAGGSAAFRVLTFPCNITQLLDGRYRDSSYFALLESGEIYHWSRADGSGVLETMTLASALSQPTSAPIGVSLKATRMNIPPVLKFNLGLTLGAAIVKDTRALYVFSTKKSIGNNGDKYTPHLLDLDCGTLGTSKITPPYVPCKARINEWLSADDLPLSFTDIAVGDDHVVALTTDGQVFAAGAAWQGQLGIGDAMFTLDDEDPKCYEWTQDTPQFAEDWVEVKIPKIGSDRKIVALAAGFESTLFVVAKKS